MSQIMIAEKSQYPVLKKAQRRHIGVIRERIEYLQRRQTEVPEVAASYHRDEAEALEWALHIVDQVFKEAS